MASKLKTQEVILQSPNGLQESTLSLSDSGIVSSTKPLTLSSPTIIGDITKDGLPMFACRAFGVFNGTKDSTGASSSANTNRQILNSGNIASILRNGTGSYTATFITPMPNTNYTVVCSGRFSGVANDSLDVSGVASTSSTFNFTSGYNGDEANLGTAVDAQYLSFAVFY